MTLEQALKLLKDPEASKKDQRLLKQALDLVHRTPFMNLPPREERVEEGQQENPPTQQPSPPPPPVTPWWKVW